MTAGYALAIKRLYGAGIVRVASKHNLREIAAEIGVDGHIDPSRIADNIVLRGPATAEGVAQLAKSLMDAAGVTKCRKTAVMALELLFTLPAGMAIDLHLYFEQATSWAERHFGVPVLSCVVHLDEGAPHAHALLLPLVAGRMGGSDLHGGKAKLWAMQTSFHEEVGASYGLARQTPQKRISAPARTAAIKLARAALQANSALTDAIIEALLLPHAKDPAQLLLALGIAMPDAKTKRKQSFVAMMTAPCALEPRNPIGKANRNPIGKAVFEVAPESQPYTCVGKGIAPSPNPAYAQPLQPAVDATVNTPAVDQRQQAMPVTGIEQAASIADQHHDTGGMQSSLHTSGTPATSTAQVDQPDEIRRLGAGPAPAQPGISENTETGATSLPTPTPASDGSVRSTWPSQPPAGDGNWQRQRDTDHPAEHWDSERGEWAWSTGPPRGACHLHP